MMNAIKEALSESSGQSSASRIGMWALIAVSVLLKVLAGVIIYDSYFVYHEIPSGETVLVVLLGASVGSDGSAALLYFSNQYGNRMNTALPEPPANDSAFDE